MIEDNKANRDLIARYLELYDFEVTVAVDGTTGFAKAKAECSNIKKHGIFGWAVAIVKNRTTINPTFGWNERETIDGQCVEETASLLDAVSKH